jgi:glycyl-tRNA synthetase alpha chain
MGRIRNLSRAVAQAYYDSRAKLGFPMWEITKENAELLLQEFGDEYMAAVAQRAGDTV